MHFPHDCIVLFPYQLSFSLSEGICRCHWIKGIKQLGPVHASRFPGTRVTCREMEMCLPWVDLTLGPGPAEPFISNEHAQREMCDFVPPTTFACLVAERPANERDLCIVRGVFL